VKETKISKKKSSLRNDYERETRI